MKIHKTEQLILKRKQKHPWLRTHLYKFKFYLHACDYFQYLFLSGSLKYCKWTVLIVKGSKSYSIKLLFAFYTMYVYNKKNP